MPLFSPPYPHKTSHKSVECSHNPARNPFPCRIRTEERQKRLRHNKRTDEVDLELVLKLVGRKMGQGTGNLDSGIVY